MKLATFFSKLVLGLLLGGNWAPAQTIHWEPINGPGWSTVTALAIKKASGHIFAGTSNGLFRSADNDNSWMAINTGLASASVRALVINTNGNIFAGTSLGVFHSTNNGDSWIAANNGLTNRSVSALAANPTTQEIFAGTSSGGVFRSVNHGASWDSVNAGLTHRKFRIIQALAINPANGEAFAGTDSAGFFRLPPNSNVWLPITINAGAGENIRALFIKENGTVFAGTLFGRVYRSTDGLNWNAASQGLPGTSIGSFAINSTGELFAGTDPQFCSRNTGRIFRSQDNGDTWTALNPNLRTPGFPALAFTAGDHLLAGTAGVGVLRSSDNGANWKSDLIGATYPQVQALGLAPQPGDIFAGTSNAGIFRSTNQGSSWELASNDIPACYINALAVNAAGQIFAGTGEISSLIPLLLYFEGAVYRSDNNGESWTKKTKLNLRANEKVISFVIDATGRIFAGTKYYAGCNFISFCDYGDVYLSTDNGDNWRRVAAKLQDGVNCLGSNSRGRIFAGTNEGIFRAVPNLDFWHKLFEGDIYALAFNDSDHIFMGTSDGMFRSKDNGDSWDFIGFRGYRVWTLAFNPATREIFAGTNIGGVFHSTNNGEGWLQINSGLTNRDVRALTLNRPRGQLWAVTNGGGVFRTQLTTGVKESVSEIPRAFTLAQNHPNPFNPSTVIKYELPQAVDVQLAIFDLMGRRVRTLVNQKQQAGSYEAAWDGRNEQGESIASGLYIYQLRAGTFTQARRMALVR